MEYIVLKATVVFDGLVTDILTCYGIYCPQGYGCI